MVGVVTRTISRPLRAIADDLSDAAVDVARLFRDHALDDDRVSAADDNIPTRTGRVARRSLSVLIPVPRTACLTWPDYTCYHDGDITRCAIIITVNETKEILQTGGDPFEEVAPFYDHLMWSVPYKYWLDYLDKLWKHHEHQPSAVLDLACGTGTVSLMLARRGLTVTGVEPLRRDAQGGDEKSGERAALFGVPATGRFPPGLGRGKVRHGHLPLRQPEQHHRPAELAECFRRVYSHLTPDALFVFDLNMEYAFTEGMFNQRSSFMDGPLQYEWRSRYDRETRLCTIDMGFVHQPDGQPAREFHETHRQRAYEKLELREMLTGAGFDGVVFYDAYTLKSPRKRSDRIFVVATKRTPSGEP